MARGKNLGVNITRGPTDTGGWRGVRAKFAVEVKTSGTQIPGRTSGHR